MPEAMKPPLSGTLILLRWRYLIPGLLWKSNVLGAFYAVFFTGRCEKAIKIAFRGPPVLQNGVFWQFSP
jgi:hypothetical protein